MWLYILISLITFLLMEFVAWFTHKYIMHGFLWRIHADHHSGHDGGFFEKNDLFFVIFAAPAILLFLVGSVREQPALTAVAAGITMYGFCYFLVHDVFIHQRFRYFRNTDNFYLKAIRKAHKMHHKHLCREDGECFGMLLVPLKYFLEALRTGRKNHVKSERA